MKDEIHYDSKGFIGETGFIDCTNDLLQFDLKTFPKDLEKATKAIMEKEIFFFTPWTIRPPKIVADKLETYYFNNRIEVYAYTPWYPFSKAIGYTNYGSNKIFINKYKIKTLTPEDLTGLLLHELAHLCGYNHGTGKRANYYDSSKANSVPYFLSNNAKDFV